MTEFLVPVVMVLQLAGLQAQAASFLGQWEAPRSDGPRTVEVRVDSDKLIVVVDGLPSPLDGKLYSKIYSKIDVRPSEPYAIVAQNPQRLFILRREDDHLLVEMFSSLGSRPPSFWSQVFVRSK